MITATVTIPTSSGLMVSYSRNYSTDMSIQTILNWAANMGLKGATINDILLSEYTGSST